MKTLGGFLLLFLLYVGIFGANIENKTFTFKSKPFIREWISSGKAEEDLNKLDEIKDKTNEFIDNSTEKLTESSDKIKEEINSIK